MSIAERLRALAQRVPTTVTHLETEEATKNALVMPFLSALGYDVFNPTEVVPEFTADVGTKKGEKVDYAIKRNNEITILVEAKKANCDLDEAHASQLYRYFSVTSARVGILTNGVVYRFFSDLEEPNRMDERPFFEVSMLDLKDAHIHEIAKMSKEQFDLDGVLSTAHDLKALGLVRAVIESQIEAPDEDFVRFCFQKANPSCRFVASAREAYTPIVKKAFSNVISDRVTHRLRSALESSNTPPQPKEDVAEPDGTPANSDGIVTLDEEIEAYRIVKAIVCSIVSPERVAYRDAKSYFSVLLDDNNRKTICRLNLHKSNWTVTTFDDARQEHRHPIQQLDELYRHADTLRKTVEGFLAGKENNDDRRAEIVS